MPSSQQRCLGWAGRTATWQQSGGTVTPLYHKSQLHGPSSISWALVSSLLNPLLGLNGPMEKKIRKSQVINWIDKSATQFQNVLGQGNSPPLCLHSASSIQPHAQVLRLWHLWSPWPASNFPCLCQKTAKLPKSAPWVVQHSQTPILWLGESLLILDARTPSVSN